MQKMDRRSQKDGQRIYFLRRDRGKEFTGAQVREKLGLRSACFEIKCTDDEFKIIVHGYGHGVGMSQYGADYMARQGSDWQEIIKHYYTGVEIK